MPIDVLVDLGAIVIPGKDDEDSGPLLPPRDFHELDGHGELLNDEVFSNDLENASIRLESNPRDRC